MPDPLNGVVTLLERLIDGADLIFYKALSKNDRSWADDPNCHQNGPYIPAAIREADFFPPLISQTNKPHIFNTSIRTIWPQASFESDSRLSHYSNKGPETHFTRVPHSPFSGLSPASIMIIARIPLKDKPVYRCAVFDSASDEYDVVLDFFELPESFNFGIIRPSKRITDLESLIQELIEAIKTRSLDKFLSSSVIPDTKEMAANAKRAFLAERGLASLNPYSNSAPGDILAELIQFEYEIFKKLELRKGVAELATRIFSVGTDVPELASSLIIGFEDIKNVFKGLHASRVSRAGTSFELHILAMLVDGNIPHDYQKRVDGRKTPDFIIPSAIFYNQAQRRNDDVILLSAKTTLRERWQQILNEGSRVDRRFLTTLDQTVTGATLDEMEQRNVYLVVPERYKNETITEYKGRNNVINFKDFFTNEIIQRRPLWPTLL